MHIPDGFLDPKLSQGLMGMAVAVLGVCFAKVMQALTAKVPHHVWASAGNTLGQIGMGSKRILTQWGEKKIQRMGLVASWIFAAQMFNFPIGSGTSGHLIGGVFASVLLGPFAGAIVLSVVLLMQSFFFADGGLMTLGANIINMGVIGSMGGYTIYIGLKKLMPKTVAVAIAAWFSVVLSALACALEMGLSGTTDLSDVTTAMLKSHALIGLAEAGITVFLLRLFEKEPHA